VLPDYQGIGIGGRFARAVALHHRGQGYRVNLATSHPAMIAALRHDPAWKCINVKKQGGLPHGNFGRRRAGSGRPVVGFEFLGEDEGQPAAGR
jgi:hypothetical protein